MKLLIKKKIIDNPASFLIMSLLAVFILSCSENGERYDVSGLIDNFEGKYNELTRTYDRGSEHWVETIRVAQDPDNAKMPYVKENYYGTGFDFYFIPIYHKYSDELYGSTEGSYSPNMGHCEISILNFEEEKKNKPLAAFLPKGTSVNGYNCFESYYYGKYTKTSDYEYDSGTIFVKELTIETITLEFYKVKYVDYDKEPYMYVTINGTMSFKRKDKNRQ